MSLVNLPLLIFLIKIPTCSSLSNLKQFLCRVTPANCQFINVSLVQKQTSLEFFKLNTHNSSVGTNLLIKGSSKTAVISGLNYYLRVHCNTTLTEFGLSHETFKIVQLNGTVYQILNELTHFYGNICAYSYSYWAWNWDMWEKHIDWIAFRGFNMIFVPTGIEYVNLQMFKMLGLHEKEIYEFFNGPAYLAWSRMGNMKNFTAPLTPEFINFQTSLHKNISRRFNELGAKVVIPGFSGFVPRELMQLYNKTNFNDVSCWNGFKKEYSCLVQIDPTKELYRTIGNVYMKILLKTFQSNHFYAVDMFNENTPKNTSLQYLQSCGKNTVSLIKSADPHGVWLLQGWTFGYDPFWESARVESYLKHVENSDIVILDMFAEVNPTWNRTQSFYGKPFIWSVVNNFGGNTVINGNIRKTLEGFNLALKDSLSLIGFGFMPEGIYENTIFLDAVMQFTTLHNYDQSLLNPSEFYAEWKNRVSYYRYSDYKGSIVTNIADKLYSGDSKGSFPDNSFVYQQPGFHMLFKPTSEMSDTIEILLNYLEIIHHKQVTEFSKIFFYDMSSVLQSYVDHLFYKNYEQLVSAYEKRDINLLTSCAGIMIKTIQLLDEAFSLLHLKSLPCYQSDMESFALLIKDNPMKLSQNLRLQLTTWGYDNEVLDYAFKLWSGLLDQYYKRRWETFFEFLQLSLLEDTPFDDKGYKVRVTEVERTFVTEGVSESCIPWGEQSISKFVLLAEKLIWLHHVL